ncbi:MAG TPA: cupredoxin domain-containing protein [Stellaceae bacterium]|nr:cupredoxin domain-containing protein [Stellaceae bacterium]
MSTLARGIMVILLGSFLVLPGSMGRAAARDWSHARSVRVLMFDYRFEPSRLVLRRGVPYRLHLVNRGKEWHELTAPEFFRTVALGNAKVLNETNNELAVPPGGARDLYLIPQAAGRYGFYCADHDWAGMVGSVSVR